MKTAKGMSTHRPDLIARLASSQTYDIAIVGGGATGLGVALDAASRGLRTVLVESHDFASGTSSRATKLVHGGVRYLAQGHIGLVREALHERSILIANAPHLAHRLPFVIPSHAWWQQPFYGAGLKAYDCLAGSHSLGATAFLTKAQTLQALPNIAPRQLLGGVQYWDGQFDDARLAISLACTAAAHGALLVNYCKATALVQDAGRVTGLRVQDVETGLDYAIAAGCVINATGVWVDGLRPQPQQGGTKTLVRPSRGVHLVVDKSFLPGDSALMIPKTSDGRVLFAVPWLGSVILGTTDTPVDAAEREPKASASDVDFILGECAKVLERTPTRQDVRSVWAGLRPLVQDQSSDHQGQKTKQLSREHTIEVGANGLLTVTGGKWTTYRAMAEDVMASALQSGLLPVQTPKSSITAQLPLLGADSPCNDRGHESPANADFLRYAVEHEFARTTTDILTRRSRLLFLDAHKAANIAPKVAQGLTQLGDLSAKLQPQLDAALQLATQYQHCP